MERLVLVVGLVAAAVAAAAVLRPRRPLPPTQPAYSVPAQLDRADFAGPHKPWLIALFTSATCSSCHDLVPKAQALASDQVEVQEVEYGARRDLHDRYQIDVVPLLLVADPEGVVRASFIGAMSATDLWAAVAEAREPGSSPEPDLGRQ